MASSQASGIQAIDPRSLAMGISCYFIWGFFPLYFVLLSPANALEVIVHRAIWGLATCLLALLLARRFSSVRAIWANPTARWRLIAAGWLIVVNWTVYVFAIQHGHTIDASIGYFINPLVTVALARFVMKEELNRIQGIAIALGCVAVLVLVIGNGRLPWVSLILALSFGFYSLVKKKVAAQVGALEGMTIETAAVAPFLLAYLGYLAWSGQTSFQKILASSGGAGALLAHALLLVGAGILTVIPLLIFAKAARGLPLGILGLIQYCGPIIQLIIGIAVFHEEMSVARWVGTGIIWLALVVLSVDWVKQIVLLSRIKAQTHD